MWARCRISYTGLWLFLADSFFFWIHTLLFLISFLTKPSYYHCLQTLLSTFLGSYPNFYVPISIINRDLKFLFVWELASPIFSISTASCQKTHSLSSQTILINPLRRFKREGLMTFSSSAHSNCQSPGYFLSPPP